MVNLYVFGAMYVFLWSSYPTTSECVEEQEKLTNMLSTDQFIVECIRIDETNTS